MGAQKSQRLPCTCPPCSAEVAIGVPDGKVSYAEVMKKARREVNLEQLDLWDTRIQKDVSGGLLIQIPGNRGKEKARQLQDKLQKVLGQDARVAMVGGCNSSDIKAGPSKPMINGMYAIWLQCPVDAVQALVKLGRIRLEWTLEKVVLLPSRRL
ncbi:uncharacterized protein LOC109862442 [Pseudomyrmex gracilis]|uniref:uncharacterized protein LOC109862442 n=1 Tax=Pseudomyrmex gracilis TaxID=219809 RepID=UPI000995AFE9|nr:uncharacterized protein LOC109862442 [Pseudomyrmex gracilis]